ncbi:transcriptional activator hac1 [Thelonectria olida]|uniref:Transcriptional activator hac1 n=1 Tax=Thelonectria olida TaxID=1576542 RepID=A0A9P9AL26_9HYPO|nr:transcriptional activator hac1 [Thelonectria olida]
MAHKQTSPIIKFENSPAESFLSAPGDSYTSLFAVTTPTATATMNPMEVMTPKSFIEETSFTNTPTNPSTALDTPPESPAPSAEKKPSKKRKSWGQVLPEPKTNLPPRKRAKTDDEKEQRRVERVLRNRRAAQSSRERKRLEVEALEQDNKDLKALLAKTQKTNLLLVAELERFRRSAGVVTRSSSPLDSLRDNPVTLSQELFSSKDGHNPDSSSSLIDDLLAPSATVNPASLSPELSPVAEVDDETLEQPLIDAEATEQTLTTSPDLTQCPAETLYDLQCPASVEMAQSLPASQTSMPPALAWLLQLRMMLLSASTILSACQRPMTQIALSSKAGFSLLPTPQLLTTIIWLVTLASTNQTSTSSTSSIMLTLWQRATTPLRTMNSLSRAPTLRLKFLRKILSSSPSLARPLSDATLMALRLVSEKCEDRAGTWWCESNGTRDDDRELSQCLSSIDLPSKDVLVALFYALKVEDWRIERRQSKQGYVSNGMGAKRSMTDASRSEQKRCRLS